MGRNVGTNTAQIPLNAVPLEGESEIRAQDTGTDFITLTAPSTMDADFIRVRGYTGVDGSTLDGGKDMFVVSSRGGLKTHRLGVGTVSSESASYGSTMFGQIYTLPVCTSNAVTWTLPQPEIGAMITFIAPWGTSATNCTTLFNTSAADKIMLAGAAHDGMLNGSGTHVGIIYKFVGSSAYWHPIIYSLGFSTANSSLAQAVTCTASS